MPRNENPQLNELVFQECTNKLKMEHAFHRLQTNGGHTSTIQQEKQHNPTWTDCRIGPNRMNKFSQELYMYPRKNGHGLNLCDSAFHIS